MYIKFVCPVLQPSLGGDGGGSLQEVPQPPQPQCADTGHPGETGRLLCQEALQPSTLLHHVELTHIGTEGTYK